MRLSNKNKIPLYNFYFTFLLVMLGVGFLFFTFDFYRISFLSKIPKVLFLVVPIISLSIFYFRGNQIFEYDSDGEALNFKNRSPFPLFGNTKSDEFPKYKLLKYSIENDLISKRLNVIISSKKSGQVRLRYDISYLTKKEIRDLKISLNKVLKANNKETEND